MIPPTLERKLYSRSTAAPTSEIRGTKFSEIQESKRPGFFIGGNMIDERVMEEYERLVDLFKDVEENKTKLVDELLMKAAFLKVQLDELEFSLKKNGAIQYSNKGNMRESVTYKTYLKTLTVYQGIIKTLSIVMGKNTIDDDDEFDEFLRSANL